jgi:hypothetical protein
MTELEKMVRSLLSTGIEDELAYQVKQDYKNGEVSLENIKAVEILGQLQEYVDRQKPLRKWDQTKLPLK